MAILSRDSLFTWREAAPTQKKLLKIKERRRLTVRVESRVATGNHIMGLDHDENGGRYLKRRREEYAPFSGGLLYPALGSMKGENMKDQEVYRRAREVNNELCEMRKQWVKMYDLITKLMDESYIEEEKDTELNYTECAKCPYYDCDEHGIRCMLKYEDRPCK